jgi:hypothetical protein
VAVVAESTVVEVEVVSLPPGVVVDDVVVDVVSDDDDDGVSLPVSLVDVVPHPTASTTSHRIVASAPDDTAARATAPE